MLHSLNVYSIIDRRCVSVSAWDVRSCPTLYFLEVNMVNERESITAKLCAFARAWHSNISHEKIYDDHLAYDMMGKDEYNEMYDMISRGFSDSGLSFSREDTEQIINEYIAPIPLSRIHFSESRLLRLADQEENEGFQS